MANTIKIDNFYDTNNELTPIQKRIFELLGDKGPLTRNTLVKELKTPRTTIYDNLLKLQKRKLIEKSREKRWVRGRPLVYWQIKKGWSER